WLVTSDSRMMSRAPYQSCLSAASARCTDWVVSSQMTCSQCGSGTAMKMRSLVGPVGTGFGASLGRSRFVLVATGSGFAPDLAGGFVGTPGFAGRPGLAGPFVETPGLVAGLAGPLAETGGMAFGVPLLVGAPGRTAAGLTLAGGTTRAGGV